MPIFLSQDRASAIKLLDELVDADLVVPSDEFYFDKIRKELHPYYLSHTFANKCLMFFVDSRGRQWLWYLNSSINYFVVSKCVSTSCSNGMRWFWDIPENHPDMEDVVDLLKESVEIFFKDLVDKVNIEVHVLDGSKDRVLSWQTDTTYGLIWAVLNTPCCSTPISISLDVLNRVSSPPLPLTPTLGRTARFRFGEVTVQVFFCKLKRKF